LSPPDYSETECSIFQLHPVGSARDDDNDEMVRLGSYFRIMHKSSGAWLHLVTSSVNLKASADLSKTDVRPSLTFSRIMHEEDAFTLTPLSGLRSEVMDLVNIQRLKKTLKQLKEMIETRPAEEVPRATELLCQVRLSLRWFKEFVSHNVVSESHDPSKPMLLSETEAVAVKQKFVREQLVPHTLSEIVALCHPGTYLVIDFRLRVSQLPPQNLSFRLRVSISPQTEPTDTHIRPASPWSQPWSQKWTALSSAPCS
jgi:hypothetical protein